MAAYNHFIRSGLNALQSGTAQLMRTLPIGGLVLGLVFFALSLTPSLLPRGFVLQGILSGCVFAAGYAIGVTLQWLLDYLGLRLRNRQWAGRIALALVLTSLAIAVVFLWLSTGWQNSIRAVMDMPEVETSQPVWVAAIAVLPATILVTLGTLLVHGVRIVAHWLARLIPPRVALVGSIAIVGILTSTLVDGVVVRWALAAADRFYAEYDTLAGRFEPAPTDPLRSGSAASLVRWDTIGQDARVYVETGPTAGEIAAITGKRATTPLRVYVGLRSAETVEQRAALALAEMERVGAFEKSVLVLIMPVGTGWVDPPAIDTLEILHGGDVASVALQYSYLTSWLSLVVEPEVGTATAQALFSAVYAHWTELPPDDRPKLYLHGLSLGAYASQTSSTLYSILADPIDGALWVGPPFASAAWRSATANRQPGTPEWLPRFEDGSIIRFTNQDNALGEPGDRWGPVRLVYLQYPSDPIVFFEPRVLYARPRWLDGERAADVSPQLRWYPVVTFLQLALDMALSQTSPVGYGHVYAPQDYFDAWVAVTAPPGWTDPELDTLRERLIRHGDRTVIDAKWFREG